MPLRTLSDRANAQLPEDAYDVRGWEVRTEIDGEKVGRVDDMILDERDRPRYLDVDLGLFKKHVLLPLSQAHADPTDEVVWIEGIRSERLEDLPSFDHDLERIGPEYEERLAREYRMLGDADSPRAAAAADGGSRLARLDDLEGYRVAKGMVDPRGWKLVGAGGQVLGEVRELIVDARAMSTRYLDCSIREDKLDLEPLDRHILVPVDRVRLDRSKKHALVEDLLPADLRDYPIYQGLPLDESMERSLDSAFSRSRRGDGRADVSENRFFGVRSRPGEASSPPPARPRGRPAESDAQEVEVHAERREGRNQEVRIRITGDDIIIEKHPSGSRDDG